MSGRKTAPYAKEKNYRKMCVFKGLYLRGLVTLADYSSTKENWIYRNISNNKLAFFTEVLGRASNYN